MNATQRQAEAWIIVAPLLVAVGWGAFSHWATAVPNAETIAAEARKPAAVSIKVLGATSGKLEMGDGTGKFFSVDDDTLAVTIAVRNETADRKVDYRGTAWRLTPNHAWATDELGNRYALVGSHFFARGQVSQAVALYPGKSLTDVLLFEPPVKEAKTFRIELPAESFGEDGFLTLTLKTAEILRQ